MMKLPAPAVLRRYLLLALACLLLLISSLIPLHSSAAQEPVLPAATPDALTGLEIYAQRCANCHGPTGAGDGAMVAQLPAPPRPFDETYRRTAQPSAMFSQITNGNLNVGMPPFGPTSSNPISEANRWDLVAAVFSLSTPPEAVAQGQAVYEAQCAACHGEAGAGDGPDAATTNPPATDLTNIAYWFNRSNQTVFDALAPGAVAAHEYEISDEDRWAVVDYARTFSYAYADPAELTRPIPSGVIFGQLVNGTTGERLADTEVLLRAFTPDFQQTLTLTTTSDINGNYRFDVTDVPPDWVFIAGAGYDDLSFSSQANQLDRSLATLELPVTVYDKASDASAISIGQLHVVLEFVDDRVQVNELYIFNNNSDTVFVGPSGDPAQGTVEVALPTGAQNLMFQRSFGSLDSFLPANDFVQTDRGWADPLPLRPGPGALTLLVRYDLPYSDGMTVAHPMFYDTATSTIILPDTGVEVRGEPWLEQPAQQFGQGELFRNYSRAALAAGDAVSIELRGRPRVVSSTGGASVVNRNQTIELVIGGAVLLAATLGGVFLWRSWQTRKEDDLVEEAQPVASPTAAGDERDALLRAIADLDDAHDAGQIDDDAYQTRRDELKRQLAAVWDR